MEIQKAVHVELAQVIELESFPRKHCPQYKEDMAAFRSGAPVSSRAATLSAAPQAVAGFLADRQYAAMWSGQPMPFPARICCREQR